MKILNMVTLILMHVTSFLQIYSGNVVCYLASQWLSAAYNHLPAIEKQCNVMTLSLRQYMADILSQISNVIQLNVLLQ